MRIILSLVVSLIALYFIVFYETKSVNLDKDARNNTVIELDKQTRQMYEDSVLTDSILNSMDETSKEVYDETGYRRMTKDEVDKQQQLLKGLIQKK